jgi:asparagine synthase (glutamine-hydrolysing)
VELRRRLVKAGHRFGTKGDVEVLLRLLMEEGEDGLPLLDGQFAFAFADRGAGTVLLARDRVGIKPLHYSRYGGEVVFASEIKALRPVLPEFRLRPESIDLYVALRYVPAPWTIYEEVEKLPAGTSLLIRRDGRVFGPRPWYQIDQPVEPREADEGEVEARIGEAVRSQLVADVPLGCLLSGGVDSSVVAALGRRELQSGGSLKTLTVGFDEPTLDERPFARTVAEAIGSDHEAVLLGEESAADEGSSAAFGAFDEPFADSSVPPSDLLFSAARRRVTVALGGEGGDELFFGYRFYHRAMTGELLRRASGGVGPVANVLRKVGTLVRPAAARLRSKTPRDHWIETRVLIGDEVRRSLYAGTRLESLPDPLPATAYVGSLLLRAEAASAGDPLRALMLMDLMSFLPECGLTKVDRLSMRHSLEVRVPLLANAVLDLALRLPTLAKAEVEGARCVGGKRPLKEILSRHVPALDTARKKRGFGVPFDRTVSARDGGAERKALLSPAISEWLNRDAALAILRGDRAGGVRRGEAALILKTWLRFLEGSARPVR